MKQIFEKNDFQIVRFDNIDFLKNPEELSKMFSSVFDSAEDESVMEDGNVETTLYDFFFDEKGCLLYFMLKDDKPVSTVLFSTIDKHKHLEIVGTHEDYRTLGCAKTLLNCAFMDMANNYKTSYVTACVNEQNFKSQNLHESLSKLDGVRTITNKYNDKVEWTFDISKLAREEELSKLL